MATTALDIVSASQFSRPNALKAGVIQIFNEGTLYPRMPQTAISGNAISYNIEESLNLGFAFRGLNEAYSAEGLAVLNPQVESLRIIGGDLDVDLMTEQMLGTEARAYQMQSKVKALRLYLEKQILVGDSSTNPKAFDGLKARIPAGSSQLITNATNGAGLSLDKLDELIDAVDASQGQLFLVMNRTLRRRLSAANRVASAVGNIQWESDSLGRRVVSYAGIPIVEIDHDETGSQILGFTETCGNTSANSSVYAVVAGPNACTLITNGGLQVRDLGEVPDKPVRRVRLEQAIGMAVFHPRAIARLEGVTNAAVTA